MPDPNQVSAGANGAHLNFTEAPGGDIPFDSLFPNEEVNGPATSAAPGTSTAPATSAPAPEFFLKAGNSVYKTAEDAATGVQHKDSLISRYRGYLTEQGIDPDTFQTKPKVAEPTPNDPFVYLNKGSKYFDDLSAAVAKRDPLEYERVQRTYNQEIMQAQFGSLGPLISDVAQQRAARVVSQEAPGFNEFISSESYKEVRAKLPILDSAIKNAESNYALADQLPQLYQMAFLIAQGRVKPEPLTSTAPAVNPPTARQTSTPSTMTPPVPSGPTTNWAQDTSQRKQLIKDMEARGIRDMNF